MDCESGDNKIAGAEWANRFAKIPLLDFHAWLVGEPAPCSLQHRRRRVNSNDLFDTRTGVEDHACEPSIAAPEVECPLRCLRHDLAKDGLARKPLRHNADASCVFVDLLWVIPGAHPPRLARRPSDRGTPISRYACVRGRARDLWRSRSRRGTPCEAAQRRRVGSLLARRIASERCPEPSLRSRSTVRVMTSLRGLPLILRWAAIGAVSAAVLGGVVGLVVGLLVHPATAWFAVFELGIPASILGGLLGLACGAYRVRRPIDGPEGTHRQFGNEPLAVTGPLWRDVASGWSSACALHTNDQPLPVGPVGTIGGRSAVARMPGGAAQTYGIAFTGRFAV